MKKNNFSHTSLSNLQTSHAYKMPLFKKKCQQQNKNKTVNDETIIQEHNNKKHQTTVQKIKKFISSMRQKSILSWFEKYLVKTQAKFYHRIEVYEKKQNLQSKSNQAICSCSFTSQNFGTYGPITISAQNASEALISAIKILILQWILQDQKCNKDYVIECLKQSNQTKKCQIYENIAKQPQKNSSLKIQSQMKTQIALIEQKTKNIQQQLNRQKIINRQLKQKAKKLPSIDQDCEKSREEEKSFSFNEQKKIPQQSISNKNALLQIQVNRKKEQNSKDIKKFSQINKEAVNKAIKQNNFLIPKMPQKTAKRKHKPSLRRDTII